MKKLILVFSIIGISTFTRGQEVNSYLLCKLQKAVRTVRIEKQGASCIATYTKNGADEEVGRSTSPEVCARVVRSIRSNLERGNWKCKDVTNSRISTSE